MKKLLAALTGVLLTFAVQNAEACSCTQLAPNTYLEQSDLSVLGTVKSRETVMYQMREDGEPLEFVRYEITIQHVFKGNVAEQTVYLISSDNTAACGMIFTLGREYRLFANLSLRFEGEANHAIPIYWTGMCYGNHKV